MTIRFVGLSGRENVEHAEPSLVAVADYVERIDGHRADQLYIELTDGLSQLSTVCMFHGRDDLAGLLIETTSDGGYLRWSNGTPLGENEELVTATDGGSEIQVKRSWLVPFDFAVRNLWYVLVVGEMNPNAEWDREGL